jgi:predicted DNA-binding protein YlxM (UPF0122 family)
MFSSVDEIAQTARNAVSDCISQAKENMTKIEAFVKRVHERI